MDKLLWMAEAISKTGEIDLGTEFLLKDLFDGVKWNNLSKGDRLGFGRLFKEEVLARHVPNIYYIGKAQNNSAKYKKMRSL